jgi:hypothetical protein
MNMGGKKMNCNCKLYIISTANFVESHRNPAEALDACSETSRSMGLINGDPSKLLRQVSG